MSRRILISRLSALGDVVCTLPVACALKDSEPDCHITWVVDPRFAGIAEGCDAIDSVLRVKPGFHPKTWPSFAETFDVALDMQGLLKSAIAVGRAKAKAKLGYHWQREGAWLFSRAVLPDPSSNHIVDQYVDVARAAGATAHRARFGLVPSEAAVASIREKLSAIRALGEYVVVNAGAGWVTKRYPPDQLANVIDQIADAGLRTVLVGGKADSDRQAAAEVESASRSKPHNMLGETTIGELVALIDGAKAHLGGDTGSTHIAAALDRPAVGLYSITRPQRSCPYGQVHNCLYHPDGLAHIEPKDVFTRLMENLK